MLGPLLVTLGLEEFSFKRSDPASSLFFQIYFSQDDAGWLIKMSYQQDSETSIIEKTLGISDFKNILKQRFQGFNSVFDYGEDSNSIKSICDIDYIKFL